MNTLYNVIRAGLCDRRFYAVIMHIAYPGYLSLALNQENEAYREKQWQ